MKTTTYTVVNMNELMDKVQELLCTVPVGQMYPTKYTKTQVESFFYSHFENYGASNGVYVPFWVEVDGSDRELEAAVKTAIAKLIPGEDRILIYHSW